MRPRDRQHARLAAAARGFVLLALLTQALWGQDTAGLLGLAAVAGLWSVITVLDSQPWARIEPLIAIEAVGIGAICGLTLHPTLGVLGVLAVVPFTAGIYDGVRGVMIAMVPQLLATVTVGYLMSGLLTGNEGKGVFSWNVTALGLGLIGAFLHTALHEISDDPLAPYLYAQTLIRQLIDLSGGLDSGLDPVSLGGSILSAVRDELPTTAVVVYVPRGDTLSPLVTKTMGSREELSACEDIAVEAWASAAPLMDGHTFAFPLMTDAGAAAVVAGILSERIDPRLLGVDERINDLVVRLQTSAVHLDTALLFAAFRDTATAEERRRLAREMHDGVAQDIASLGYLVDALATTAATPVQAERMQMLRDRITGIVSEIRRSVVTLRTSVGASESLGTAIGSIARNLTEVSGVPIQVTLDERTARLRPEVEAELFRITQEAMNNAVKHAQASKIDVHCQVHAPGALITVSDDGRGLQAARATSHGMAIMRERARLIRADLAITTSVSGGLLVSVHIPADRSDEDLPVFGTRDRIGA